MEDTTVKHETTHSLAQIAPCDVLESKSWAESLQPKTGMTPSRHTNSSVWTPFPPDQPVILEAAVPTYNERRLEPHEWVELLEQTECLDYVSPDVEACMKDHLQLEGNQELELTGREFIDSPPFPMLPSLNALSSERSTVLKSILRPQRNVSRRPGLREQFPRQQPLTQQVQFEQKYVDAGYLAEQKTNTRRSSRTSADKTSASRSLKFEAPQNAAPQKFKAASRRKRASWSGQSSRSATTPRRQSKSARKSKDCVIPGCAKGARSRGLCKRHGGGKRCTYAECTRSDQGGGFCIAHGGGKRCAAPGCKNSAQSRGLCKSHGGGKRCREEGCSKSSQAGGYCRGHRNALIA